MDKTEEIKIKELLGTYSSEIISSEYVSYPLVHYWKKGLTHEKYLKLLDYLDQHKEEILSLHIRYSPESGDTLDYLFVEIDLIRRHFTENPKVHRVWLDSNNISVDDAIAIIEELDSNFEIDYRGEISLTANAVPFSQPEIEQLTEKGFNHVRLVIDEQIQTESEEQERIAKTIIELHENGVENVQLDILLGYQGQTERSIADFLEKILQFNPDRIRFIFDSAMENKNDLFLFSKDFIETHEWYLLGSNLYIKEADRWYEANNQGLLDISHIGFKVNNSRNVLGIGRGANSYIGDIYTSNLDDKSDYESELQQEKLPTYQFHAMTIDDKIRKYVISQLSCRFTVFFDEFKQVTEREFSTYFSDEIQSIEELIKNGMVRLFDDRMVITEVGECFLETIVRYFDKYGNR